MVCAASLAASLAARAGCLPAPAASQPASRQHALPALLCPSLALTPAPCCPAPCRPQAEEQRARVRRLCSRAAPDRGRAAPLAQGARRRAGAGEAAGGCLGAAGQARALAKLAAQPGAACLAGCVARRCRPPIACLLPHLNLCVQAVQGIEEEARQHFARHQEQHGDPQPCDCGACFMRDHSGEPFETAEQAADMYLQLLLLLCIYLGAAARHLATGTACTAQLCDNTLPLPPISSLPHSTSFPAPPRRRAAALRALPHPGTRSHRRRHLLPSAIGGVLRPGPPQAGRPPGPPACRAGGRACGGVALADAAAAADAAQLPPYQADREVLLRLAMGLLEADIAAGQGGAQQAADDDDETWRAAVMEEGLLDCDEAALSSQPECVRQRVQQEEQWLADQVRQRQMEVLDGRPARPAPASSRRCG